MTGELIQLTHQSKPVVEVTVRRGVPVAERRTTAPSEVDPRPAPQYTGGAGRRALRIDTRGLAVIILVVPV